VGLESLQPIRALLAQAQLNIVVPFLLAVWMAWSDLRTRRIPNFLNLGCLLTGLGYQLWAHSWTGLLDGLLGISLGFILLIFFYWKAGMGAGDVKALAALGAWLGVVQTLYLFIYMALAGVLVAAFFLWRRGFFKGRIRQLWVSLVNRILLRPHHSTSRPAAAAAPPQEDIPYGLALALGMAILCGRSFAHSSSCYLSYLH
jgi:prepilin peptidase CpaA